MRRIFFLSLICITTLFILSACKSQPKEIKLSKQDAGKTIEAKLGDIILISLEGNPTTGYNWELDSVDTNILKQKGEAEFAPKSEEVVGSSGMVTLTFETLKVGETSLKLVYHRPWESGVPPADTFEITLKVK